MTIETMREGRQVDPSEAWLATLADAIEKAHQTGEEGISELVDLLDQLDSAIDLVRCSVDAVEHRCDLLRDTMSIPRRYLR